MRSINVNVAIPRSLDWAKRKPSGGMPNELGIHCTYNLRLIVHPVIVKGSLAHPFPLSIVIRGVNRASLTALFARNASFELQINSEENEGK
jgi:hypothetical protein